ncbi:hypothetical protein COB11_01625 [Candidatus Aerophobetes bacterium]|uniref:Uncharacterized protein n=1 Tax=Aerophobetes bacterium TaxID=2030807 RepID=A0A2A4YME1_UNCAE|nr:MAG: hypothetical protein COB11_01625 [Candidatus Aerophobetes bacterium]
MSHEAAPVSAIGSIHGRESAGLQLIKKQLEERNKLEQIQEKNALGTHSNIPRWMESITAKNAVKKFSCYMIFLNTIVHMSLSPMQGEMTASAQLMNTQHQIQQNLLTMSSFLSYIKSNATADGAAYDNFTKIYNPNAMNGLKHTEYMIDNKNVAPRKGTTDYGEKVSPTFTKKLKAFIKAFKQTFYANTDPSAPTFQQLSHIGNPNVLPTGKSFDLSKYWGLLNKNFHSFNQFGHNVFATKPGETSSLIQQYCYLKAKVATYTDSKAHVNGANGDISKLVDFQVNDNKKCDPMIKSMMQIVTSFESPEHVTRSAAHTPAFATSTQSGLYLMLSGHYKAFAEGLGPTPISEVTESGKQAGLYGYFSEMAFNYFWTKNPNASKAFPKDLAKQVSGVTEWTAASTEGIPQSDHLSSVSLAINSNQTNMGQAVGEGSITIQAVTTNEGQDVNIVQTGLKGKKEADTTMLNNQKT